MRCALLAVGLLFGAGSGLGQKGDVANAPDPCMTRQGKYYYIFSTGAGIPIRRSEDLVHWKLVGRVFDTSPAWTAQAVPGHQGYWAPDISFYSGTYHLYYSLSRLGKRDSAIGLATNKTLDPADPQYRWVDEGLVIRSYEDYDWNAIDPALVLDRKGQPWMAWGSYWSGIKLRQIDPATGKPSTRNTRQYDIASRVKLKPPAIEGAIIAWKNGYFYLFVSFDGGPNYKVMVGRSREVSGPYVDRQGKSLMDGGGTLLVSRHGGINGPGHNGLLLDGFHDWFVVHYTDAQTQGSRSRDLQLRPLMWASDGWPLVGEPEWVPAWAQADSRTMPASPVGSWEHGLNYEVTGRITLLPNGTIDGPVPGGKWVRKGWFLTLKWPAAGGGHTVESGVLSPDGKAFSGRDQSDRLIGGRKAEVESNP